jgi:hypothetical protein
VIDPERWFHLLDHLLEVCTDDDPDPIRAERAAVLIYAAVHERLEHPML